MLEQRVKILAFSFIAFTAIGSLFLPFEGVFFGTLLVGGLIYSQRSTVKFCYENKPIEKVVYERKTEIIYVLPNKEEPKEQFIPTVGFLKLEITTTEYNNEFKQYQHCYERFNQNFEKFENKDECYFETELKFAYKLKDIYLKNF